MRLNHLFSFFLFQALADPYFKGLAKLEREPSCQSISKFEFEFERRRVTKEDIRELIFREILEYHPQLLKDYMAGNENTSFQYPRFLLTQSLLFCLIFFFSGANTYCYFAVPLVNSVGSSHIWRKMVGKVGLLYPPSVSMLPFQGKSVMNHVLVSRLLVFFLKDD